jgi:glutaconate CoA-transferase, subunit B
MVSKDAYTASEIMCVRAAKELHDGEVVFVGIGLPNVACNLARETHAPKIELIYESGAVGACPERLPISIGDPALVTGSLQIVSQAEIFQNYLQGGKIEVGFLGGAQIDPYGNLNTTVIGDYKNPKVRLPGSGGACEIAVHAKRVLIVMRLNPKAFVKKCDFITSPGQISLGKTRSQWGMPGRGPVRVITDKCVFDFENGEMIVTEIYAGETVEAIQAVCGFPVKVSAKPTTTTAPTPREIDLLRNKLDPKKLYL